MKRRTYSCPAVRVTENRRSTSLQKPTFLKQPSHFLVFSFTRLSLQTQVPELVTIVFSILVLVEAFLQPGDNDGHWSEVIWHCLPSLNIHDHFGSFLTFAEVDHIPRYFIFRSVVDEGQCGQVSTFAENKLRTLQSEDHLRTNEWNTRWCYLGQSRTIIIEILVGVDSRLASG